MIFISIIKTQNIQTLIFTTWGLTKITLLQCIKTLLPFYILPKLSFQEYPQRLHPFTLDGKIYTCALAGVAQWISCWSVN